VNLDLPLKTATATELPLKPLVTGLAIAPTAEVESLVTKTPLTLNVCVTRPVKREHAQRVISS
jgi:hypothetical protein